MGKIVAMHLDLYRVYCLSIINNVNRYQLRSRGVFFMGLMISVEMNA